MMLRYLLVISTLFITLQTFSQDDAYVFGDLESEKKTKDKEEKKGFDWDRVVIGGGVGLMVNSNNTLLGVSPTFGYYITDNIILGIGAEYTYQKNFSSFYSYYSNTYGGKVFGQYIFDRLPILAHVEAETVTIDINFLDIDDEKIDMLNLYVGGGLNQRLGNYSSLYLLVLYNLNETTESNYVQPNPIIRVGISLGL